jgi:hypothetical protein
MVLRPGRISKLGSGTGGASIELSASAPNILTLQLVPGTVTNPARAGALGTTISEPVIVTVGSTLPVPQVAGVGNIAMVFG